MALRTWTLLDQQANFCCEQGFELSASDVGDSAAEYRILVRVGRGGLSDGVQTVTVDNGAMHFDVLTTRGMGIWKAWYHGTHGDEHIGWESPVRGPVHPQFVPLTEPSGLGWLDGFDELLARCGLESNGAPDFDADGRLRYPLHGRIANRPAHRVDLLIDKQQREIALVGLVEETRVHFQKLRMKSIIRTPVGSATIHVQDEITNLSASPTEIQMLYHVNFGQPLLDAGARVVVPAETVVPRNARAATGLDTWDSYAAEQPGFQEQVYFLRLLADPQGNTQALLKNAHGTRGASLKFNRQQLPCFTVWKNTTAKEDGYVTGLEPGTNFPNPRSFEGQRGRVARLPAGGRVTFELTLDYHRTGEEVAQAENAVQALSTTDPHVFRDPQPDWCSP